MISFSYFALAKLDKSMAFIGLQYIFFSYFLIKNKFHKKLQNLVIKEILWINYG